MLDWAHRSTLRAVGDDSGEDCPALRNLVASGLVERRDDGCYAVTPAGRAALDASEPERWEKLLWPVVGVGSAVVIVDTVIDWVT